MTPTPEEDCVLAAPGGPWSLTFALGPAAVAMAVVVAVAVAVAVAVVVVVVIVVKLILHVYLLTVML